MLAEETETNSDHRPIKSDSDAIPSVDVLITPKNRIVIGEGDKLIVSVVRDCLEREGFEVVAFFNGANALKSLLSGPVSLILIDVKMPGMYGFELLERLKTINSFDSIPFVMMISPGSEKDIARGMKLGANDHIIKPFSIIDLLAKVDKHLK